jgi:hypothetical protein
MIVGFWSQTFECFMPVECMTAAAKKIMEVEAENERLKRFLHRDNLTEA